MADLIDRLAGTGVDDRPKINLHRFVACERLYALSEWTRAEIAAAFDLQGAEATQAATLADKIDAQSVTNNKLIYVLRVESVAMCLEDGQDTFYHNVDGTVNRAKVYEDLLF